MPLVNLYVASRSIPMVFVSTDSSRAARAAHLPGVLGISVTDEKTARLVLGIDMVVSAGAPQNIEMTPNGIDIHKSEPQLGYPILTRGPGANGALSIGMDSSAGFWTRRGVLCALNVSWGVGEEEEYDPAQPFVLATRWAAERTPVVIAAGNWHHREQTETLSAWAESPWVISVGATDRADGGELMDSSSAGSPSDPMSGPTVVAFGVADLAPKHRGTSYAAPHVTRALLRLGAWALTLRHFTLALAGGLVEGVPLVDIAIVDKDIDPVERSIQLPALPAAGVDRDALSAVLRIASEHRLALEMWPTPARLRQMLIASAQPLANLQQHQGGAGFVSDATTLSYLQQFSGADLLQVFANPTRASAQALDQASQVRLAVPEELSFLMNVWKDSARIWAVDIATPLM